MSRLTADRLAELYRAVLGLVAEHGFDRLTMDRVAEATRSSKATLYRQWGSKEALVAEALRNVAPDDETPPDTGSLAGDLHEMVDRGVRNREATNLQSDLIAALMRAVKSSPELAAAVRTQVLAVLDEHLAAVIAQAVERGEVGPDARATPHLSTAFIAPFVLHDLVVGHEADAAALHAWIDDFVLPAVLATP